MKTITMMISHYPVELTMKCLQIDTITAMLSPHILFAYQFCKHNGDPLDSAERSISVVSRSQYFIFRCYMSLVRGSIRGLIRRHQTVITYMFPTSPRK